MVSFFFIRKQLNPYIVIRFPDIRNRSVSVAFDKKWKNCEISFLQFFSYKRQQKPLHCWAFLTFSCFSKILATVILYAEILKNLGKVGKAEISEFFQLLSHPKQQKPFYFSGSSRFFITSATDTFRFLSLSPFSWFSKILPTVILYADIFKHHEEKLEKLRFLSFSNFSLTLNNRNLYISQVLQDFP